MHPMDAAREVASVVAPFTLPEAGVRVTALVLVPMLRKPIRAFAPAVDALGKFATNAPPVEGRTRTGCRPTPW